MADSKSVKIDRFDGSDFGFWKMQIEDVLYQKGLYQPLTGTKPDDMKQEDWLLLDRKALGVVRLSLAKNVAYNIVSETTTAGVLTSLSNMYEKPSALNKVFLIRQLVNTRMQEGASAADHVNEFNSILTRLKSVGVTFEDELEALFLLSSLPESWSGTVTAVSGSTGTTKLKFEGIRDLILSEGIRRKDSPGGSGSLLSAAGRGRGRSRSRTRSKRDPSQVKNVVCWNCQQEGHYRSQCPNAKSGGSAAAVVEDALVCREELLDESWILDSGASYHASPYMNEMFNFRRYSGRVRIADGNLLDVAGIGDLTIKHLDYIWILRNVRFIPKLAGRLISIGQLDDEGCHILFGDQKWVVFKGGRTIACGFKRGTTYMVDIPNEEWLGVGLGARNPSMLELSDFGEGSCLSGSSGRIGTSGDSGRFGYTRVFETSGRSSSMATMLQLAGKDEQVIFRGVTDNSTSVQWELARVEKLSLSEFVRTFVVSVPTVKGRAGKWKIKGVMAFSHSCLDSYVHVFNLPGGLFFVGKIDRVDGIWYGWVTWLTGSFESGRAPTRYLTV